MSTTSDLSSWWSDVEGQAPRREGESELSWQLRQAAHAEGSLALSEAELTLARAVPSLQPPFLDVARLLDLRIRARRASAASVADLDAAFSAFVSSTSDVPTRTRARQWRGMLLLRFARYDEGEQVLLEALAEATDRRLRAWIIDGLAQAMMARGAWEEARHLLAGVSVEKKALGDKLGVAISAGHLGVLHLARGEPAWARNAVAPALQNADDVGDHAMLRLLGIALQAELEEGEEGASTASRLRELLENSAAARSTPARGHACLALARFVAKQHQSSQVRRWLDDAEAAFSGADRALLTYWQAELFPGTRERESFSKDAEAVLRSTGPATEGEIRLRLLLAETAGKKADRDELRRHLDLAFDRSQQSNSPLVHLLVAERFLALDPIRYAERSHERYSGRTALELRRSTSEEATLVFCDMVGFSTRASQLEPDAFMVLVRGLFEHAGPLLARHRVQPLQHMGDGLLAAAQGPEHHKRGLAFARDFISRIDDAAVVRRALGDQWTPQVRAGVASGVVVFGTVGSLGKQEYLAIGKATNLAARLQAEAKPGEVVCFADCAHAAGIVVDDNRVEHLKLKGFERPLPAVRFPARS